MSIGLNEKPPPLHYQDNHAGNTAIEEVIYVVRAFTSREFFFQGDKVGEPLTPLETQLRIKLMLHDRSQVGR